jgi:colanic acid/amylovoran biosynthesis glycosyltransferase
MSTQSRQTIAIYRDKLLPTSETFVRAQAESLIRYRAIYLGLLRQAGLSLPESRVHIVCGEGPLGKVQRIRFKVFGSTLRQRRKFGSERPVLLHAHFGPGGCEVSSTARALDIPLVVTLHGYDVTSADDNLPALYVRRRRDLQRTAARFICVSEFLRTEALKKGFPPEKTIKHYTGVDTAFFRADASLPRWPVVLFVGRLVPNKGCEYVIRAVAALQESRPDVKLVVIGDGPLRTQLEEQSSAALQNYEFLGAQPPEAVRSWMNRAKVLSVPGIQAESGITEAFGMVFAEALAMGLPIVSSAIGGVPEIVADGQNGFLVPERDWKALASKMLLVLENQDLWDRFSRLGKQRVDNMFDLRKQATLLENIYDSVLTECRGNKEKRETEQNSVRQVPVGAGS